jgi:CubicO group peptidase (beta-lactamase class C family)
MKRALAVALLLAGSPARADLPVDADRFVREFDDARGFSGTVLIAQNGKIVVEKGYGFADADFGVKNDGKTKFRLGSITKTFTATLVMMLEQEGRLGVADKLCKYLPECPRTWDTITLHQVLSHTSGIPNYTDDDFEKVMATPTTPLEIERRMAKKPLDFAPGVRHKYSNTGYVLLGMVIEKASGKPYETYVRERIFGPLGMNDSGYEHNEDVLQKRARGYTGARGRLENAAYIHMSVPGAAGGLYSTVEDLLKWDQALYGDKLLPRAVRERMFTPVQERYGYGWVISTLGTHKVVGHSGGIPGFATELLRFTDDKVTVIVLANREDADSSKVAEGLAEAALGMPYQVPVKHVVIPMDAKKLDLFVGDYELAPGFVIVVRREGDQLTAQATKQPKFPIFPEGERQFFLKVVEAQVTFLGDAGQPATSLVLHQNGQDMPGKKIH